ncbi:MAG: hypothetical protein SFW09_11620 [Hyphomicrobiaceae bacterium]|nr:hypothetical protein [Hyphomicrobiaceae bacterium]
MRYREGVEASWERRIRALLPSIAVMPYFCLDREFGRCMTFAVTSGLMTIADLHVISASSTIRSWARIPTAELIRRRLRVRFVLAGQIVVNDQMLTFSHRLLDLEAGTEYSLAPIEKHISHLYEIEEQIVVDVLDCILPSLGKQQILSTIAGARRNIDARTALLQAIVAMHTLTSRSFARSERLLHKAQQIDPGYAEAFAWNARLLSIQLGQGWSRDRMSTAREALRLADLAVAKNDRNALALATAGHCHSFVLKDYEGGLSLLERALEACVNEPFAWLFSGVSLAYTGRPATGVRRAQYALTLSPYDRCTYMFDNFTALCHYANGDFENARRLSARSVAANPNYSSTYRVLAASLAALGRIGEARQAGQRMLEIEPGYPSIAEQSVPFTNPLQKEQYLNHIERAGIISRRTAQRRPPEAAE